MTSIVKNPSCREHLSRLFKSLPSETIDALDGACLMRSFRSGQTVIADGKTPDFLGCIASGILRMQRTMPDGHQSIVGLLVENEMFGLFDDETSDWAIEAATDVRVCIIPRDACKTLIRKWPELEHVLLSNVLNELNAARDWIMVLGSRKVIERFSAFLLLLCRRWLNVVDVISNEAGVIEVHIPLSRQDVAKFLATRPETVSRVVHTLSSNGIIEIVNPQTFKILDLPGLIEMSGNQDFAEREWFQELTSLVAVGDRR